MLLRRTSGRLAIVTAISGITATVMVAIPGAAQADVTDQILIGAGDIAGCSSMWQGYPRGDHLTADILEANPNAAIFTAGDNSQDYGRQSDYANCYARSDSWGQQSLFDRTRPAAGNHDYLSGDNSAKNNAAYYYQYFGSAKAGNVGEGYYSYDLGNWHVVVLNSNCSKIAVSPRSGCGNSSYQMQWLEDDLEANNKPCVAAYWHAPLVSRGSAHPGLNTEMQKLFNKLYEYKTDIVMNGHNHVYERYGQLNGSGAEVSDGIREFVVGTGGTRNDSFTTNSYSFAQAQASDAGTYGVLKLTLQSNGYEWEFIPVAGEQFTDSSASVPTAAKTCHAKP